MARRGAAQRSVAQRKMTRGGCEVRFAQGRPRLPSPEVAVAGLGLNALQPVPGHSGAGRARGGEPAGAGEAHPFSQSWRRSSQWGGDNIISR